MMKKAAGIFLTLVLNLAMVLPGTAAQQGQMGQPGQRPQDQPRQEQLGLRGEQMSWPSLILGHQQELGLNQEQVSRLKQLDQTASSDSLMNIHNRLMQSRQELQQTYWSADRNRSEVERQIRQVEQLHAQLLEQHTSSFLQARNVLTESQQQHLLGFAAVDYSEPWYEFWNWFGEADSPIGKAKPADTGRAAAAQAGLVRQVSLEETPKAGDDQQQDQPGMMPGQEAKDKAGMMQGQAKDKAGMMQGQKQGRMPGMMPGQAKGRSGASGAMRGMGGMAAGGIDVMRALPTVNFFLMRSEQLGLSAEQVQRLAGIRQSKLEAIAKVRGRLIQAQDNYWIKLGNTRTTLSDMRGLIDELRDARTEYRLSQLDANEEATAVLDEEQKQQAFAMLRDNMGPGRMLGEEPAEEAEE